MFKYFRYNNAIYWSVGFFSTSQILALVFGGRIIALYSIFLFLVIADLLVHPQVNNPIPSIKIKKEFLTWMYISIAACFFGYIYFMQYSDWQSRVLGYIPKILMYLVLFYLLQKDYKLGEHANLIIQGIKIGIIVNVVWSIADAITFYTMGYSLTNNIFSAYIQAKDIRYGTLSLIDGGFIRSGGLNADPANLGIFATILASYAMISKKYLYLLLAIGSAFASVSFIAIYGIILVSIFHFLVDIKNGQFGKVQVISLILLVGILLYLLMSENTIVSNMLTAVNDRMESKVEQGASNNRSQYWINFIPAVFSSPLYFFIGTGYMTASYPYLTNNLVTHIFEPYDPECTYFSNYFDFGLIGFVYFIMFYINIWRKSNQYVKKIPAEYNIMMLACIEGTLIAFGGYHYTLYSVVMLFSILAVLYQSQEGANI